MGGTVKTLNDSELLLWTILYRFESLALKQYQSYLPELVTNEKKELINTLSSQMSTEDILSKTTLSQPLNNLLQSATGSDATDTLIIQGLLLETLGQTIYQMFKDKEVFSPVTQSMCSVGLKSGQITNEITNKLIAEKIGLGEQLYQIFITISKPVVIQLDTLGEVLDQHFSRNFNICFSDLLGDFVSELLPRCTALGMERRQVIAYLTSVLMGI